MRCSDYIVWISQRLDGSLPPDRFAELEEHLAVCGRCRAEYRLQKKIIGALSQEVPSDLSPDFTQRVMARAMEVDRARRRAEKLEPLVPALVFAAAAIVLFIFRSEVAGVMGPGMEVLGDFLGGPLSRLGGAFAGLIPGSMSASAESTSFVQRVSQPVIILGTTAALVMAAAVWAMRKAADLIRG
ncbi:MAG: zf-HC2 domain-containing protein [bacterium]|jgi:anti-sigma factor RsiW